MEDIVKQRSPPKNQKNTTQPAFCSGLVHQPKKDEGRSECHEQVVERRRILERVKERDYRQRKRRLNTPRASRTWVSERQPGDTVSVSIEHPQQEEQRRRGDAEPQTP